MSVKNKGSWCEKHNQYARTKFDCPHCELDELRERVRKMLAALDMVIVFDGCARKAVEELL